MRQTGSAVHGVRVDEKLNSRCWTRRLDTWAGIGIRCYRLTFIVFITSLSLLASEGFAIECDDEDCTAIRSVLDTEFPEDVEASLAEAAAPRHLRDEATIYVYKRGAGYKLYRSGTNGFSCLVNRDGFLYGSSAFKPTCWDVNGKDSYVPVMIAVGRALAAGMSTSSTKQMIDERFESGLFSVPRKVGVAYMLVGDIRLDIASGEIEEVTFPGHLMIYASNVTNDDIGASIEARRRNRSLPFVFSGGAGGSRLGYIITTVACPR